jgi:octaprenyl-diphosphate synthase
MMNAVSQVSQKVDIRSALEGDLHAVNALIVERMDSPIDMIPSLAKHLVMAGGKRVRPRLALSVSRLLGHAGQAHVKLAACIEFIHTATLLHDDVVDGSPLRRGRATANILWGNQASILVGDFLFSRAFVLMVEMGSLDILNVLSQAASRIAEGEVMQLMNQGDINTTLESYFRMIEAKTAQLFEAAAEAGVLIAQPEDEALRAKFKEFGRCLGLAFQITDDVLDYDFTNVASGKKAGTDFEEGKITLPLIYAYENAPDNERIRLQEMFTQPAEARAKAFHEVADSIKHSGALQRAHDVAVGYANHACGIIEDLPASDGKELLLEIARGSAARQA